MVAVAAHELRSPVSVILGYHELIADGIYGELDERGQEALGRIRQAAEHQLRVLEGTVDLVSPGRPRPESAAPVQLGTLVETALGDARAFGIAYAVEIDADPIGTLPTILADGERLRRAVDMTFAAAVKSSPGRHITFRADAGPETTVLAISGTGLDPQRDDPGGTDGRPLAIETGAALRIAIARRVLDGTGSVDIMGEPDAATIELRLTAGTFDPAAPGPASD
jgi:signal transduction histidine kinase